MSKPFLLLAASTLLCLPAQAGTILPNLYAQRFCSLMSIGANVIDARKAAISYAWISEDNWINIDRDGQPMRSDVIEAATAVVGRCPQYVGN